MKTRITLLIMVLVAFAQANISVEFDKDRIEAGKSFTMSIVIPMPELPPSRGIPMITDLQGFSLDRIDSADEKVNSFFTGRMLVRKYNFRLVAPKQGGAYQLPVNWELDGKDRTIGKIRVDVQRPYDAPALTASLTPSKTSVFEGEQFSLTMNLAAYENFQGGLNLNGIDLGNDFVAHRSDLAKLQFARSTRPGVNMEASAKVAWVAAIRSGSLVIPELRFKYQKMGAPKVVNKQMGNMSFSSVSQQPEEDEARSGQVRIEVRPLPANGKPAEFTGLVGQYTFEVQVDRTELQVGEALTLLVKVRGNGKPGSIPDPKLPDFSDFRSVPPESQVTKTEAQGSIYTERVLKIFLYPKKKGEFHITPIKYNWFDPAKRTYVEQSSPEYVIRVEKGDLTQAAAAGGASFTPNAPSVEQREIEQLGQDIRFIHEPKEIKSESGALHRNPIFWLFLVLPFGLATFFARWAKKRHALLNDATYQKKSHARETLDLAWNKAQECLQANDSKAVLAILESALMDYVGALHNCELGGLTRTVLTRKLQDLQLTSDQIDQLMHMLTTCDQARFSPMGASIEDAKDLLSKAKTWADNLGRAK